ncbi:MAG: MBL fold metallo-hydrolase [Desulfobacterales bacterium]|nr:MBL fold metallo-hydrolase [Desulfobacterales bacterium]
MTKEILQRLAWLGHDGYRLDGDPVIYFDPYEIKSKTPADIILVSHEHFDHCSPDDVVKIQKEDTVIVTDIASAKKLRGDVKTMKVGDRLTVKGVEVEAVPAYNVDKQFHPKDAGMLGFIINIGGVRIYHAGDTDFIPEMKDIETDIALLPVSGTYVMTAEEAIQAAQAINPKVAIPMHYGAIVGDQTDAERFRDQLAGKMEVVILEKE